MKENAVRLQKYLADQGVCSRRRAEELIAAGRVQVNGARAELGQAVDPAQDRVALDGRAVRARLRRHTYIMLYKPRGVVTTMRDELGRRCVQDLLHGRGGRVFPVGRLDRDSEGMLLMTDDGALANALTSPKSKVPKTYRVTVDGELAPDALAEMEAGMTLGDGLELLPAQVHIKSAQPGRSVLLITLCEGKNRQIRRMCEQFGLQVKLLKRERIGDLRFGKLKSGEYRFLEEDEIRYLKQMCGLE